MRAQETMNCGMEGSVRWAHFEGSGIADRCLFYLSGVVVDVDSGDDVAGGAVMGG